MNKKIPILKDNQEIILNGKQLREFKKLVIKDFFNFKPFLEENISGHIIISSYWLEHLLNLFFQGYISEVWKEIMETKINNQKAIEDWGYGIIGQEFDKKHLEEKGE